MIVISTVVLYAVTAVYFAGVMVRLMLTLTPVVCVLAAVAFSVTLDNYLVDDQALAEKASRSESTGRRGSTADDEAEKKKKKENEKVTK